ncbi:hypothetical protein BdWA1_000837 [Babesia duncani]|uniref:Uncharacterized protein n=1 Tax=Babesia duncani TaxID=323732 RepID=A0AAD9PMX2_9APIC|nr:hypothetical protein BdWA1_000837 [Babesia duncani]
MPSITSGIANSCTRTTPLGYSQGSRRTLKSPTPRAPTKRIKSHALDKSRLVFTCNLHQVHLARVKCPEHAQQAHYY